MDLNQDNIFYYLLHLWRIKEFIIILEYRKLREILSGKTVSKENQSDALIQKLCQKYLEKLNLKLS